MPGRVRTDNDYYSTLGVAPDASAEEIKKAYRRLALQWHPDRNQEEREATERFQEISEAYAVLIDPVKRREYDELRSAHAENRFRYSRDDLFRDLFTNPSAGAVFEELAREFERMGMRVDRHYFEQTLFGGRAFIAGGVFIISPLTPLLGMFRLARAALRGMGAAASTAGKTAPPLPGVSTVLGSIGRFGRWLAGLPTESSSQAPVPASGDLYLTLRLSRAESDSGVQRELKIKRDQGTEELLVKVPPGVRTGTRLRVRGKGCPRPGGSTGDLYLAVEVADEE